MKVKFDGDDLLIRLSPRDNAYAEYAARLRAFQQGGIAAMLAIAKPQAQLPLGPPAPPPPTPGAASRSPTPLPPPPPAQPMSPHLTLGQQTSASALQASHAAHEATRDTDHDDPYEPSEQALNHAIAATNPSTQNVPDLHYRASLLHSTAQSAHQLARFTHDATDAELVAAHDLGAGLHERAYGQHLNAYGVNNVEKKLNDLPHALPNGRRATQPTNYTSTRHFFKGSVPREAKSVAMAANQIMSSTPGAFDTTMRVRHRDLYPTQSAIDKNKAVMSVHNPNNDLQIDDPEDWPTVAMSSGKLYLLNNHEELAAHSFLGDSTSHVKVIKLDNVPLQPGVALGIDASEDNTTHNITSRDGVDETSSSIFGRPVSTSDIARMSGAPDGSNVDISHDAPTTNSPARIHSYFSDPSGQKIHSGLVTIHQESGAPVMKVESVDVHPAHQGKGIGQGIAQRMIANAKKAGVSRIDAGARRGEGQNGYYSWACYGFDAPIPFDRVLPLPPTLSNAKTIQDLMKTQEGQDWWKKNGTSVRMTMHLNDAKLSIALDEEDEQRRTRPTQLQQDRGQNVGPTNVGPTRAGVHQPPDATQGRVAGAPPEPSVPPTGGVRQGTGVAPHSETPETGGPEEDDNESWLQQHATDDKEYDWPAPNPADPLLNEFHKRVLTARNYFQKYGHQGYVEWLEVLHEHALGVGTDTARESLREEVKGTPQEKVLYKTPWEFDESDPSTHFTKHYLDRAGIVIHPHNGGPEPGKRTISAVPVPAEESARYGPNDVIPTTAPFEDKLTEAKKLPGLESSEDIHKLMGTTVTHLTPEVMGEFDKRYGPDGWIVKSYNPDQAYNGFGVHLPGYAKEIHERAKVVMSVGIDRLKDTGYRYVTKNGVIIGVSPPGANGYYKLDSDGIPDPEAKLAARIIDKVQPHQIGARLPTTAEEEMKDHFGITLRKDETGKVIGIKGSTGENSDIGSEEFNRIRNDTDASTSLERALESVDTKPSLQYMVQPRFPKVGATAKDLKSNYPAATGNEGRAHVVVYNGIASAVPYATSYERTDAVPTTFYHPDVYEQERAAERAIQKYVDNSPEFAGHTMVFAPDMMRTQNGWEAVEANKSAESGASAWLEHDPNVIDAITKHMIRLTGGNAGEPLHAKFARKLLTTQRTGLKRPPFAIPITDQPEPSAPNTPATLSLEKNLDNLLGLGVHRDWDRLRAIVVGRGDNDVLPAWQPSFANHPDNAHLFTAKMDEPESAGKTRMEFDHGIHTCACEQVEALCALLKGEGVQVFRPPMIDPNTAQEEPVGLSAAHARDVFTVIGDRVIVHQHRAAHRNKDKHALRPLFDSLEQKGLGKVHRPPAETTEKNEDYENDKRCFIEGGDIFRLGDAGVLVTISHLATSPTGYRWLADLLAQGDPPVECWPAYLARQWVHGNQVLMPVREGLCVAYLPGFVDGCLPTPITDWDCVELTRREARLGWAANGLVLGKNRIMLPQGNRRVRLVLEAHGVEVVKVPFDGAQFWRGAIHSATSELWRGNKSSAAMSVETPEDGKAKSWTGGADVDPVWQDNTHRYLNHGDRSAQLSPVKRMSPHEINFTEHQPSGVDLGPMQKVMETQPEKVPPVVVERHPTTNQVNVVDGAHRLAYAQGAGMKDIPVREVVYPGRSNAVNPDGTPIVLYHGSKGPITQFTDAYRGKTTGHPTTSWGHFFTPDPNEGKRYSRYGHQGDGYVTRAHVELKNPYVMSGREFARYSVQGMEGKAKELADVLRARGHDGIHIDEGGWEERPAYGKFNLDQYVAFHPNQIKVLP